MFNLTKDTQMSNKKYNPKDYKDAEFLTVGDGPVRIQIVKAGNLNMGHMMFVIKKLFEMECELGLIKTLAEEGK
jgi:hypothetical protein|tara:strand:- start:713 stop:934 length:222 start_codon:yes stop_codon:yes gene_type:complete